MNTAGGRRKRLGVGARTCMLTGKKKFKGETRTFSEKANKRFWRPNTRWKKLWWDREKKWVRLYVCTRAIKRVDSWGLENMCRAAGLDLYAWSRPHWMPGSRQPLALKVGYSPDSKNHRRLWPDYIGRLNKGAALADSIRGTVEGLQARAYRPKPWDRTKGKGTPPGFKPQRIEPSKLIKVPQNTPGV